MMNGVNIASNKRGRPKGQPGRCSICKTEGHNARSCLDSDRVRRKLEVPEVLSVDPRACNFCQSGGHSPSACPRNHPWLPTSGSCMPNTPLSWNTPPSTSTALVPHVPRIKSSDGNVLNASNTHVSPSALALFPTEAPPSIYRAYESGVNSPPPWSYSPSHGLKEPGAMQRNIGQGMGSPPSTVDQDLSLKSWWADRSIGGQMGMSLSTLRELENPVARTSGGLLSITRHRPQPSDKSPNPEVIRTAMMAPQSTFGKPSSAPLEHRGQTAALPQQVETPCHHANMSKMYEQGWSKHDKPNNLCPPGPRANSAFPPPATNFDSPGSSRQNPYDLAHTAATISLMPTGGVSSPLEVPNDNHSQCPIVEDAAARRRAQGRIRNPIQRLDLNEPPIESMLDGIGGGPDSSEENQGSPPKLFKTSSPPSPPPPLDDARPYVDKPASGVTTLQLMSGGKDTPERPSTSSFHLSRANQWPQQSERYIAKGRALSRLSPPRLKGGDQKGEGVVLQRDVGSWLMLSAVGEAGDVSTALCLGVCPLPGKGTLKILRTESKPLRRRAATVNLSLSPETGSVDYATESNVESLPGSVRGDASPSASPASSSAVLPSSGADGR